MLLIIAVSRCVFFAVEQPRSSIMQEFGPMYGFRQALWNLLSIQWQSVNLLDPQSEANVSMLCATTLRSSIWNNEHVVRFLILCNHMLYDPAIGVCGCLRSLSHMGSFGSATPKPTMLFGLSPWTQYGLMNDLSCVCFVMPIYQAVWKIDRSILNCWFYWVLRPWIPSMYRKFTKKEREKLARAARVKKIKLVHKYKSKSGQKRVWGS